MIVIKRAAAAAIAAAMLFMLAGCFSIEVKNASKNGVAAQAGTVMPAAYGE